MKVNNINLYSANYHIKKIPVHHTFFTSQNIREVHDIGWYYEMVAQTEDNHYRGELLQAVGLSEYNTQKISSIMGPYETQKVLKELDKSEQNFIASPRNLETGKFRANLHIHTKASDGYYTPEKLLDDAAKYADTVWAKTKHDFVIAITDHDTIGSYGGIIKEIYKNPEKYKHLKVILGMESTMFETVNNQPMQFHMLVYNINPNDEKFNNFLKSQENKKQKLLSFCINNINDDYYDAFKRESPLITFDELCKAYSPIEKGIMSSHNYLRNYALTKFLVKEVITKSEFFDDYFNQENPIKDVDFEMEKLRDYQYDLCHNNKSFSPVDLLSDFYSVSMNEYTDLVEKAIYNHAKCDTRIMDFIAKINNNMLNHKNINGQNFYVDINEVYQALSNQPNAIFGIAHPLSTVLDKTDDSDFDYYNKILYRVSNKKISKNLTPEFLKQFYNRFKEAGKEKAKFSEKYYQSYLFPTDELVNSDTITKLIDNLSSQNRLFRTGGYDSHRETIFSRY